MMNENTKSNKLNNLRKYDPTKVNKIDFPVCYNSEIGLYSKNAIESILKTKKHLEK